VERENLLFVSPKTKSYDLDRIEGDLKKNVSSFVVYLLENPDPQSSTKTELYFKTAVFY